MDHHDKRQVRVYFKKHPEPRKIVIIGPKDTSADQHAQRDLGRDVRWETNYAGYVQP